jgi:hypothetical protein
MPALSAKQHDPHAKAFFSTLWTTAKKTFQQYGLLCENCGMPPWLAEIR